MDIEPTQAIPLSGEEDGDETDDEPLDAEKHPVAHLKVLLQRGYPETLFPIYEGLNMIGRAPSCNIHIDLKALSKQHALVEVQGTEHFIVDQGSKNKTRRNKAFLKPQVRYELRGSEQLIFADVECLYLKADRPFKVKEIKDEVKETFVYEEDDSDPSSDILQPTQVYGDNGKPGKHVRMSELATQMYAADSGEDSPLPVHSASKKYFVSETPATSRRKQNEMLEDSVIPESDVEPSPVCAGNASRVSVAFTETVLYASDEEGAPPPRPATGNLLSLAATQAYVPDSEDTDNDSVSLPTPLVIEPTQAYSMDTADAHTASILKQAKKASPAKQGQRASAIATQPYSMDTEDAHTASILKQTKKTSPAKQGQTTSATATQAYSMDTEDAHTASILRQAKKTSPAKRGQRASAAATQATQAYDMDVEEEDKRAKRGKNKDVTSSPDRHSDDDAPTQTYSTSGRRIKRKSLLYEDIYITSFKSKQKKSSSKAKTGGKYKAKTPKIESLEVPASAASYMGSTDFQALQNGTLPASVLENMTASELDVMPVEVEISPSLMERMQAEIAYNLHDDTQQASAASDGARCVEAIDTSSGENARFGTDEELTAEEEAEVLQYCHDLIDKGGNCTRWNLRVFVRTLVKERIGRKFVHQNHTFPSAKWFDRFFAKNSHLKEAVPRALQIRQSQEAREEAVRYMLETGDRNVSRVARLYGITRKFLANHVKQHNLEQKMPPPPESRSEYYRQLTHEEEADIVEHCRKQESLGQPVHRTELREYMKDILSRKLSTRFNRNGPSDKWCGEFFRKHQLREGPQIYKNAGRDKEYMRERGHYNQKDLEVATEMVARKEMKPSEAATVFGIPRRTICSRVKKLENGLPVHDPEADEYKRLLPDADELEIVQYCLCQAAIVGGLIQRHDLRLNVMELLYRRKRIKKRTNPNKGPTCNWVRKFINRHPQMNDIVKLTFKKDPARIMEDILDEFFERFESIVEKMGIKNNPEHVFAALQTVLVPGPSFTQPATGQQAADEPVHQMATHMCVSAAGFAMPPCLMHKFFTPPPTEHDNIPTNWTVGATENGLLDRGLFTRWFCDVFLSNCGYDRPLLLLLNFPSSHISLDVMDAAKENEIELMCIPGEAVPWIHPLETSLFTPLRERVRDLCREKLNFWDIPQIVRLVVDEVFTEDSIQDSFVMGGLVPLSPNMVISRLPPEMKVPKKQRRAPKKQKPVVKPLRVNLQKGKMKKGRVKYRETKKGKKSDSKKRKTIKT